MVQVVIHDNTSVVKVWIRIENNADPAFISMRIRIRSQGAKPIRGEFIDEIHFMQVMGHKIGIPTYLGSGTKAFLKV